MTRTSAATQTSPCLLSSAQINGERIVWRGRFCHLKPRWYQNLKITRAAGWVFLCSSFLSGVLFKAKPATAGLAISSVICLLKPCWKDPNFLESQAEEAEKDILLSKLSLHEIKQKYPHIPFSDEDLKKMVEGPKEKRVKSLEQRKVDSKKIRENAELQQLIRECEKRCPSLEKEKKRLEKEIDKLKEQIKSLSPSQQQTRALYERQKAKEELLGEISQNTDPEKLKKLEARLARTEASLRAPQALPARNKEALARFKQELLEKQTQYEEISLQLTFEQKTISALKAEMETLGESD